MATTSPHTLDRTIFNQTLYTQMRDFWFTGIAPNSTTASFSALQQWFGVGRSSQEKAAFDEECRSRFAPALEAISPSKLPLPPYKSYEDDIRQAETIAAPFLQQITEQDNAAEGAKTLLSQILLLDQMPRNTMRDPAGLRKVYTHYDRLAYSLLRSSMSTLSPNPLDAELWRGRPVYLTWALLPLMHSEHLPSHELYYERLAVCKRECEEAGDTAAVEYIERAEKAADEHIEVVKRFGRYPHRNECLGRGDTGEEREYLKTADTFGVENSKKETESGGERDEL